MNLYGRVGHLWGKIFKTKKPLPRGQFWLFLSKNFTGGLQTVQRVFWLKQILRLITGSRKIYTFVYFVFDFRAPHVCRLVVISPRIWHFQITRNFAQHLNNSVSERKLLFWGHKVDSWTSPPYVWFSEFSLCWPSSSTLIFSYSIACLRFCSGLSLNLYFCFLLGLLLWFLFGLLLRFNYILDRSLNFLHGFFCSTSTMAVWLINFFLDSLLYSSLYGIPTCFSLTFFSSYSLVSLLLFGLICRVLALALFLGFPVVFSSWSSKLCLLLFFLSCLAPLWSSAQLPLRPFICFCSASTIHVLLFNFFYADLWLCFLLHQPLAPFTACGFISDHLSVWSCFCSHIFLFHHCSTCSLALFLVFHSATDLELYSTSLHTNSLGF